MATLLKDDAGIPIPQYVNGLGNFEEMHGMNGAIMAYVAQLDTVLASVQTIQNRVDTSNTQLGKIVTALTSIDETLKEIKASMTGSSGSDALLQEIKSLVSAIQSSSGTTASTNVSLVETVNAINTAVQGTADKVSSITTNTYNIASGNETTNTAISRIQVDVSAIKSEVTNSGGE